MQKNTIKAGFASKYEPIKYHDQRISRNRKIKPYPPSINLREYFTIQHETVNLTTVKHALLLSLSLAMSFFLTGCGGNWIVGKWTLDRELTLSKITAPEEPGATQGEGFLKDLVTGLQKGVSRMLLTKFEGLEIEFTTTEIRRIRNGVGEATGYKIIDRPDSSTCVIQYSDGEIVTWNKVESGLRMKLPGDVEQWIYFKAVE